MTGYLQIGDRVVLGGIGNHTAKEYPDSYEEYKKMRHIYTGLKFTVRKIQPSSGYVVADTDIDWKNGPVSVVFPERFFIRIDSEGIFGKFEVTKKGIPIQNCFVLRHDRDPAARIAMFAYAAAVEETNPRLAGEIREMLASTAQ